MSEDNYEFGNLNSDHKVNLFRENTVKALKQRHQKAFLVVLPRVSKQSVTIKLELLLDHKGNLFTVVENEDISIYSDLKHLLTQGFRGLFKIPKTYHDLTDGNPDVFFLQLGVIVTLQELTFCAPEKA